MTFVCLAEIIVSSRYRLDLIAIIGHNVLVPYWLIIRAIGVRHEQYFTDGMHPTGRAEGSSYVVAQVETFLIIELLELGSILKCIAL